MAILLRGLEQFDTPEIRAHLVNLWHIKTRYYHAFFRDGSRDEDEVLKINETHRLIWAEAIVIDSETTLDHDIDCLTLGDHHLLTCEDLGWILEKLNEEYPTRAEAWATLFCQMIPSLP